MSTPYQWFESAGGRQGLAERLAWRGLGRRTLAGTLGGLCAGACMIAFAMVDRVPSGSGSPWMLSKLFAASFMGVDALVGGAEAVLVGLAIHAVVSAAWGIFFAFCVSRDVSTLYGLALAVAHGFLVWSTMTWTVLPWADPTLYSRYPLMGVPWLVYHLVYGGASVVIIHVLKLFPLKARMNVSHQRGSGGADDSRRTSSASHDTG